MSAADVTTESYRLPYFAVPHRYDLRLSPDLDAATFSGHEHIALEVVALTDRIVMNAIELEIDNATLCAADGSTSPLAMSFDVDNEQVTFTTGTDIAPGHYTFECDFSGILNDKLCGFYRSSFVDDDGVEHSIATTQFESTDARRSFPCFDEPDRKAVFGITLDAPEGLMALSNGPEINVESLPGGSTRTTFGDTIKMSTYLVCFIVGPLEATPPIDVEGVALRIVHLPGKAHLTAPAIDVAAHSLGFYNKYFGIPYPGEKLDLVAIPDFAAGAMENLGCVTFREAILLADPDNVSQVEMERLAEVVEHELAHMWFGDLVTMRWWNGIWLNEAFATYMSLLCQDDYKPDWQCFVSFARGKAQALAVDGLHATRPIEFPVRHPDESSAMFDVLTYEKGAAVLWMIDVFLGGTRFRDGVRKYLLAHAYDNTETSDLWDAIEREAADVPIRQVMDSWIFQGGYPLIHANATPDGVAITQTPFSYLPAAESSLDDSAIGKDWFVPVLAAPIGATTEPMHLLLNKDAVAVEATGKEMLFNAGGAGFYRLHYDDVLREAILNRFSELSPLERYNFSSDAWAVIVAGQANVNTFFATVAQLGDERDPHVWSTVTGALSLLDLLAADGDRPALSSYLASVLVPQLDRVGWDAAADEDDQTPVLRASLIATLGLVGEDAATIARARELFNIDHTTDATMNADITSAVLNVVTAHATRSEFDTIIARYRDPRSPMDQVRHLNALAALRDPDLAQEVHAMCLNEVRSQNAPFLLGGMLGSRFIGPVTWAFVKDNFQAIIERFPENSLHRMLEGVTGLAALNSAGESAYFDDVRDFLLSHIEGGRRRLIAQSIERLQVNVAFAKRLRTTLGALIPKP